MTTTGFAVALRVRQSIAIVSGKTVLALKSMSIVNAFKTFASCCIAVTDRVQVNIAIAIAL